METSTRSLWLVDAYNVLRVTLSSASKTASASASTSAGDSESPDSPQAPWWSAEQRSALMRLAARLPDASAEICLVFDARHLPRRPPQPSALPADSDAQPQTGLDAHERPEDGRLRVIFTPSADDWIVEGIAQRRAGFARTVVVTADRRLANRARSRGAEVVATDRFVAMCRDT